eukprot:COSAG06_NODE_21915_length_741_cov_0.676012_1_plen_100_part_00
MAARFGLGGRPPYIHTNLQYKTIQEGAVSVLHWKRGPERPLISILSILHLSPAGPRRVAGRELMRLLLLALMAAAAGHAASTQHYNVTGTIDVFTDENT